MRRAGAGRRQNAVPGTPPHAVISRSVGVVPTAAAPVAVADPVADPVAEPAAAAAAAPETGSFIPGLLGRPWRPSVAQSAWSFGGDGEGLDHADWSPAASYRAGRDDLEVLPEGARYGIL